ncbi:hypothetical protein [Teichococcus aestuarii]|uniref:hypothetical protein n=1 Tax=Teichococcus aestuarii TaxID=568898 RepID=UPI00361565A3
MANWTSIASAYRTGHWINARWPGPDGALVEGRCHWSTGCASGGWTTDPNGTKAGQVFPVDWRPAKRTPNSDWIEAGKRMEG